jgi:hypothetical protein
LSAASSSPTLSLIDHTRIPDACRHRGRDPQHLVNPRDVVVHQVQRDES